MKAVVIRAPGGPEVLELRVVEEAKVGEGEVLIKVVAAALNKADCKQRKGNNPPPHGRSLYPGLECSGIIDAVGSGVSDWKVGDKVLYFVNNDNFSCLSLNFFFIIHRLLMPQSPQVPKYITQSTNPTCASSLSLHLFLKQNIFPGHWPFTVSELEQKHSPFNCKTTHPFFMNDRKHNNPIVFSVIPFQYQ
jgi:hypothetical protein